MLDINLIREHPEIVKNDLKKRGETELIKKVDEVIELDKKWRETISKLNKLRKRKNEITREIAKIKREGGDATELVKESSSLDKKIHELEGKEEELKKKRNAILWILPNILHESVPVGKDDSENIPIRFWGKPKVFKEHLNQFKEQTKGFDVEFEITEKMPMHHADIVEQFGLADIQRASKTSGSRFYYLKDKLVFLNFALIRYGLEFLKERGFIIMQPPFMVRRFVEEAATSFGDFEEVIYKIEDEDLYLIPTAEHAILGYHINEIIDENKLPLKYAGISPCFRKEAGSHGKDTKGIFRVHQFEKVEQFVYAKPEESWQIHEELIKNAEEFFQSLGIPYRVVNICTGDIGSIAAKKYDLEGWFPAQGRYRELVSCSNCTDYQARRGNIKLRRKDGKVEYLHTLNSTLVATERAICAILENYLQDNGTISVPKALRPYTGFDRIEPIEKI